MDWLIATYICSIKVATFIWPEQPSQLVQKSNLPTQIYFGSQQVGHEFDCYLLEKCGKSLHEAKDLPNSFPIRVAQKVSNLNPQLSKPQNDLTIKIHNEPVWIWPNHHIAISNASMSLVAFTLCIAITSVVFFPLMYYSYCCPPFQIFHIFIYL